MEPTGTSLHLAVLPSQAIWMNRLLQNIQPVLRFTIFMKIRLPYILPTIFRLETSPSIPVLLLHSSLFHLGNYFGSVFQKCSFSLKNCVLCVLSCLVISDSLQSHGLQPTRLFCLWSFQARILEWVAISSYGGSSSLFKHYINFKKIQWLFFNF